MKEHEQASDGKKVDVQHRRKFLKKGAATAPAVMLLLSARSKPVEAQPDYEGDFD